MKKYRCIYYDLVRTVRIPENSKKTIEANSAKEAYQKYLKEFGAFPYSVFVQSGFFSAGEFFYDHLDRIKKLEEEEKSRQEKESSRQTANELLSYLSSRKNDGYFKLSKIDKINIQCYFLYLSNTVEKRELSDGEIEFINTWVHFKDRELGQSLIAQAEARKPASERGNSELARTITMGIAAGHLMNMTKMNELNAGVEGIAEDVGDISEGIGIE